MRRNRFRGGCHLVFQLCNWNAEKSSVMSFPDLTFRGKWNAELKNGGESCERTKMVSGFTRLQDAGEA